MADNQQSAQKLIDDAVQLMNGKSSPPKPPVSSLNPPPVEPPPPVPSQDSPKIPSPSLASSIAKTDEKQEKPQEPVKEKPAADIMPTSLIPDVATKNNTTKPSQGVSAPRVPLADEPKSPMTSPPITSVPPPPVPPVSTPAMPPPPTVTVPPSPKRAKSSRMGILLSVLLLLFITIPMGVYYVSQQQQLADLRSRAAINEPCNTCLSGRCTTIDSPPNCSLTLNECSNPGGPCTGPYPTPPSQPASQFSPWGSCYTYEEGRIVDLSPNCQRGYKKWICHQKPNDTIYYYIPYDRDYYNTTENNQCVACPWPETNGQCCPTPPDNCSNPGSYLCIEDPFVSQCTLWDNSCPAGQRYYWKAVAWSDNYDDLVAQYCSFTPTQPPPPPGTTFTPTPTPVLQCQRIKIYKNNTQVDPTTLKAGDEVFIAVAGANATKGRIRVNGGPFTETATKNTSDEYILPFTIPEGIAQFTVEAEVHRNGIWQ